ncbi:hypothetical protein [Streptomyces huasconensis]|uniref:hypothetical protein n=1 Tax=Streptomyces huasconensis TaxID=1854574 RepID=UPI0033E51CEA
MTNSFWNSIQAPNGTFHTGSGPQTVHQHFGADSRPREQASRALPDDHLIWLKQRFLNPEGYHHAAQILEETHTVLVDGPPGSGRNSTARMLLHAYPALRGNLREVLPEDDEGNLLLDPQQVGDAEGLLLDLSDIDRATWQALHSWLPGYHAAVRKHGSRLAVVVPHPPAAPLDNVLTPHRAGIGAPRRLHVLRRALLLEDFPPGTPDPPPPGVLRLLEREPPIRDVARLAELITRARRSQPSDDFEAWCAKALAAINLQPEDVAQQVVTLGEGRPKALLLTTAMLHGESGARSDAVYEACEALLDTVDHPADDRPLLEREDLSARFEEIRAAPDAQGRVTFKALDYAPAVRTHFWNNMPGLRTRLGDWVAKAISLRSLTEADRTALVEHYASQALGSGAVEDLLRRVVDWSTRQGPEFRAAAVQALARGATDATAGRVVRRRILTWSRENRLPGGHADVLIAVCSTTSLAAAYPQQAAVRLHHLARRSGGRKAESRLEQLALADVRLHRLMLQRLAHGLETRRWAADHRLFLGLTAPESLCAPGPRPHALLDEKGVRTCLRAGWAVLFAREPYGCGWQEQTDRWLAAAGHATRRHRDFLLDVLVDACRGRPVPLALLHEQARPYPVAPLVLRKIDAAQGIRPSRPRP